MGCDGSTSRQRTASTPSAREIPADVCSSGRRGAAGGLVACVVGRARGLGLRSLAAAAAHAKALALAGVGAGLLALRRRFLRGRGISRSRMTWAGGARLRGSKLLVVARVVWLGPGPESFTARAVRAAVCWVPLADLRAAICCVSRSATPLIMRDRDPVRCAGGSGSCTSGARGRLPRCWGTGEPSGGGGAHGRRGVRRVAWVGTGGLLLAAALPGWDLASTGDRLRCVSAAKVTRRRLGRSNASPSPCGRLCEAG